MRVDILCLCLIFSLVMISQIILPLVGSNCVNINFYLTKVSNHTVVVSTSSHYIIRNIIVFNGNDLWLQYFILMAVYSL